VESDWLVELNEAQREAVTYGQGALLVIAGAGTGKTKTLAYRVAYLLEQGVSPDRILLLTFTRRAAAEMIGRARNLIRLQGVSRVWGGTFHAVANRLLRIYGQAIGIAPDFTVIDAGDAADMMNLIRTELGLTKRDRRFPRKETLNKIYSHTVNAQAGLNAVVTKHFPWCIRDQEAIRQIFDQYTQRKRRNNVLDYDDLLLFWRALCASSEVGLRVADRFDHILVDEYQDTNAIQAEILLGMRRTHKNIMVVGDDAQSIYSFRAATIRNILDFPKQFPGTHQVTLEQNYRSTEPILEASNAVMAYARERFTKDLWSRRASEQKPVLTTCLDEGEQCDVVCRNILDHFERGVPLMHQAVLFRAGHHSAQLEVDLAHRNIPFHKYGGLKFVEAAHIKDMLAFLRILENPYDEVSWHRVLLLLPGVGSKTAARIMGALGVRGERPFPGPQMDRQSCPTGIQTPLSRMFFGPPDVSPAARKEFAGLRQALADCLGVKVRTWEGEKDKPQRAREESVATGPGQGRDAGEQGGEAMSVRETASASARGEGEEAHEPEQETRGPEQEAHDPEQGEMGTTGGRRLPVVLQVERIRAFYEPIFERTYENAPVRLRDIEQLGQIAARYSSRSRFITDLTLDPPTATSDLAGAPYLEEDYLILSTIHSAKGCEWDVVHIIHAADGMIPSDLSTGDTEGIEEERRLFYVAMTRAKNHLYVYFPLRYYHAGRGLGDAHNYAQLTRFMPRDVCALFEHRASANAEDEEDLGPSVVREVDDFLTRLWDN
jgi:DNA helicase-2/ATP-dependent DNA helicase PcrA